MKLSTEERWHHYECMNGDCVTSGIGGCVMALRLPIFFDSPAVDCPMCGAGMLYNYTTPATESGHLATRDDIDNAIDGMLEVTRG